MWFNIKKKEKKKGGGVGQIKGSEGREEKTRAGALLLTVTLCSPVRLGHSHSSWVSDSVSTQGVSPISTV